MFKRIQDFREYLTRFDVNFIWFWGLVWGLLNCFNGTVIFNHDIVGAIEGEGVYYLIIGMVRFAIGVVTIILFIYLMKHRKVLQEAVELAYRSLDKHEKY